MTMSGEYTPPSAQEILKPKIPVQADTSFLAIRSAEKRASQLDAINRQIRELKLLTVESSDVEAVKHEPVFTHVVSNLEREFAKASSLPEVGLKGVTIHSVARENTRLVSAMVSVDAAIEKKGEAVNDTQKVELRFDKESRVLELVEGHEYDGQQLVRVHKDAQGNISLLPLDTSDPSIRNASKASLVTSFGGTNFQTEIYTTHARLSMAEYTALRKNGELLSLAEIIGQTDDLTTASVALAHAGSGDAYDIAKALIARNNKKEAPKSLPELEIVAGKGIGLDKSTNILNFEPLREIAAEAASQFPGEKIIGMVCDQITLKENTEPLLAEAVGVILEDSGNPDGIRVEKILPRLARKASVAAGVYQENEHGKKEMAVVGEYRVATGKLYAKQAPAGSSGDRGEMTLPEIVRQEIQEELGISYPEKLVKLGDFRAHPQTTERLELFSATTAEKVKPGTTAGTDAAEVTHITTEEFPEQSEYRGYPFDAKTTFLAHAGRLDLAAVMEQIRFEEWKQELVHPPARTFEYAARLVDKNSNLSGFDGRIGEFGSMDPWRKQINTIYAKLLGIPEEQVNDIVFNPAKEKWDPINDPKEEAKALIRNVVILDILMGDKPAVGSAAEAGIIALMGMIRHRATLAFIGNIQDIMHLPAEIQENYLRARELFQIDAEYIKELCGDSYTILDNVTLDDIANKSLEERIAFLKKLTNAHITDVLPDPKKQIKRQVVLSGSSKDSRDPSYKGIRNGISRGDVLDYWVSRGYSNGREYWDTKIDKTPEGQTPTHAWANETLEDGRPITQWTTDFYREKELPLKDESLINVVLVNDATSFGATKDAGLAILRAAMNGTYAVIALPEQKDEHGNIIKDDYTRARTLVIAQFERLAEEIPWIRHYVRFVSTAEELTQTADAIMNAYRI